MAAAAFLGCFCTGHGCYPPRIGATFSTNVFVNGIPAHRQYDLWLPHCCDSCHAGIVASGAGNVHINGRPAARMGDSISCGSMIAMGSPNVDFGAPLGVMSMLGGLMNIAPGLGISVPSFSDALGSIGIDVTGIDVTGWVSDNLFNGAVLPAELLSVTENLTGLIANGSIMDVANQVADLASFSNILTPGGGVNGSINLAPLQTLGDAVGLKLPQVINKLEATGVMTPTSNLSDALKMALDITSNGLTLNQVKAAGTVLGVNVSNLGLPDLGTILKGNGVSLTPDSLSLLETSINNELPKSTNLVSIISSATGLDDKTSKLIAGQLTNITLPYVQTKVNKYINSGVHKTNIPVSKVMNAIKTQVTIDIKDSTGGVVFL